MRTPRPTTPGRRAVCSALVTALVVLVHASAGPEPLAISGIPDAYLDATLDHALMSLAVYDNESARQAERELMSRGWTRLPGLHNPETGLDYAVFKRVTPGQTEIAVAFRGTESMKDFADDVFHYFARPGQYREGLAQMEQWLTLAKRDKSVRLTVTGHSLGGGIAQYIARMTKTLAFVFNAAPLHEATRSGQARRAPVINVCHEKDVVCHLSGLQVGLRVVLTGKPRPAGPAPAWWIRLTPAGAAAISFVEAFGYHIMETLVDGLRRETARQGRAAPSPGSLKTCSDGHCVEVHVTSEADVGRGQASAQSGAHAGARRLLVIGFGPASEDLAAVSAAAFGQRNVWHWEDAANYDGVMNLVLRQRIEKIVLVSPSAGARPTNASPGGDLTPREQPRTAKRPDLDDVPGIIAAIAQQPPCRDCGPPPFPMVRPHGASPTPGGVLLDGDPPYETDPELKAPSRG